MAQICLVGCVKNKQPGTSLAKDLYTSSLFRKASAFAEMVSDRWYIISAKYGLVAPDKTITCYNETLNRMAKDERKAWAQAVFVKLRNVLHDGDTVIILAGARYREYLLPLLANAGFPVKVPLKGMSIGKQLQWLTRRLFDSKRFYDADEFYSLLDILRQGLGGERILNDCTGHLNWPKRGVYFFFEPGQFRHFYPHVPRVVRIGTHAVSKGSSSTLWGRLRTHRGSVDGRGNHRGSIFRLHVGSALLARQNKSIDLPTWGQGQSAKMEIRRSEESLEREVSAYIGRMSVLWLKVDDQPGPSSDRAYIERNCIGLLAAPPGPLDPAGEGWLGNWSKHSTIRASGMWNVEHTFYRYDPHFLEVIRKYVIATINMLPIPEGSIAPRGWHLAERAKNVHYQQLHLWRASNGRY